MLTVHQKSKRSDIVQRQIRRPFSVDEVEALRKWELGGKIYIGLTRFGLTNSNVQSVVCPLYLFASMWVYKFVCLVYFQLDATLLYRQRFHLTIPLYRVSIFLKNTIRWRDIKLLAFGNAKHRTYVDLKVKTFCDPCAKRLQYFVDIFCPKLLIGS